MYYAGNLIPHHRVLAPELEVEVAFRGTPRLLLAKPGLDGHDRGAKVMAHALKDAGFEVIYTGLHQTVEMIVQSAIQEDVDVIGLSIMSGAHISIYRKLFQLLGEKDVDDIMVLVGGVIPSRDMAQLKQMGVGAVFPGGSDIDAPAEFLRKQFKKH
ncbi:MAG: cobalamin B12-binding domain-containing protein [Desulfomonile tiedjei]|uniref:Cobalamin B12-binding domain-containing protein n=1 Tax=Desulfomonile tiedjei TaxID=2358 RepID=A0A9D6UYG2_9BACT|nr:cobalamin B12-binding domain-containing protein [Desulfomonile tiedjei]